MDRKKKTISLETIERICILIAYLIMYGSMTAICTFAANSSMTAFTVFAVICMFFSYKSCKGRLVSSLNFLPTPATILLSVLLSIVIGIFTAPYHIAKWVAKKIYPFIRDMCTDDD